MTVCEENQCTACKACEEICPHHAIEIQDNMFSYKAVINEDQCVNCGICRRVCQNHTTVPFLTPLHWYQGWTKNTEIRARGSSGGVATAIAKGFIQSGGFVCNCVFHEGKFGFQITDDINNLEKCQGSKYVKSDPLGMYKKITEQLKNGDKILFIGLPCQVAALKLFVGKELEERLYTVDFICHGSPSPKVLEIYLAQHGSSLTRLSDIQFRVKDKFRLSDGYKTITQSGIQDSYSIAFLNYMLYTENCYACPYARFQRVSDLTLGDSWGSKLPREETGKGVSLLLCQTSKGEGLLSIAEIQLENVDIENAMKNNAQLNAPSKKPKSRDKFTSAIVKGKSFDTTVWKLLPYKCFRQMIKMILIRCYVIHGGGRSEYIITVLK